jgi:hypothetical protein
MIYEVKLKHIVTQTVKVEAPDEDTARVKAAEGDGDVVVDYSWEDNHDEDSWEVKKVG